jgi:hypothetical protein
MFILPTLGSATGGTVGFAQSRRGSSTLPPASFYLDKAMVDMTAAWTVMAHELGHNLGLDHTFNGMTSELLKKKPVGGGCEACVPTSTQAGYMTGDGKESMMRTRVKRPHAPHNLHAPRALHPYNPHPHPHATNFHTRTYWKPIPAMHTTHTAHTTQVSPTPPPPLRVARHNPMCHRRRLITPRAN